MMLTTVPLTRLPTGKRLSTFSHGLAGLLFETQRNLFGGAIHADDHAFDFLIELNDFGRVGDTAPTEVGDMQQAVQAAQIDEYAEIGDILDDAFANLTDFDFMQQFFFAGLTVFFDEFAAGDHDVVIFRIDLEDFAFDFLADEAADVAGLADVDLRGGQKDRHADIDEQTAFDAAADDTLDDVAFFVGGDDAFPAADAVGFAFGQDDAVFGIDFFQKDFDFFAGYDFFGIVKLGGFDHAFALEAQFDDDVVADLADNFTLDDRAGDEGFDFLFQSFSSICLMFGGVHFVELLFK